MTTSPPSALERSSNAIANVDEAIADIRAGRMVILVDDADRENEGHLSQIPAPVHRYLCDEAGSKMDGCLAPQMLDLKVGAQVLITSNARVAPAHATPRPDNPNPRRRCSC